MQGFGFQPTISVTPTAVCTEDFSELDQSARSADDNQSLVNDLYSRIRNAMHIANLFSSRD